MRLHAGRVLAAAAAIVTLGSLVPAGAGALTFGTNLNQRPNFALPCGEGVFNQTLGIFYIGPRGDNCMWTSVVTGSAAESLTAPGTGTVTAARVEMGPVTGPMQIDVVRYLFWQTGNPGTPGLACCFVQEYGPVFTPAANAITTIQTNLPVTVEPTPPPYDLTTVAATDQLALTALEPAGEVPVFATQGGAADLSVLSYAWYPAPTAGTVPAPSPNPIGGFADLTGFKVLMNADFTPAGGGAGGGGGGGGAPVLGGGAPVQAVPIPAIGLPNQIIPVRGNTATIPLQCLVVACIGSVTLQNLQQAGLAQVANAKRKKAKPKLITYGTATFSLQPGSTGKVKVTLNAAGRKLLRSHSLAKVWASVRFSSGEGVPKTVKVTLKR